ncbi:hypothetical protein PMAYCL1PPCAC_09663, partial [Pristionchus mayeri]
SGEEHRRPERGQDTGVGAYWRHAVDCSSAMSPLVSSRTARRLMLARTWWYARTRSLSCAIPTQPPSSGSMDAIQSSATDCCPARMRISSRWSCGEAVSWLRLASVLMMCQ